MDRGLEGMMIHWRKIFAVIFFGLSPAALAAEQEEFSRWSVDVQGDQQESIGYDVNLGYRPAKDIPALNNLLFFKLVPGFYLNLGVGERVFAQNMATRIDSRTARSWNHGISMKLPLNETFYLHHRFRTVSLRLPNSASQKYLNYEELSYGFGLGSAQGGFMEFGTNIRLIDKANFEKPITVGNTIIQQQAMIYPSLSVGYRL